jgi:hypothetical protein
MFASRILSSAIASAILLAFAVPASAQDGAATDPPNRVARLSYQVGDVAFAPAGDDAWGSADVNRPVVTGDQIQTGDDGRAALDLGGASVQLGGDSAFNALDIDNGIAQFELSQGTLNVRIRELGEGQIYEVDTPTVAFVASEPGNYRVHISPDGVSSTVSVLSGAGTVYGDHGVSKPVVEGRYYTIADSTLTRIGQAFIPPPDAFDRFVADRDARYLHSASRQYVPAGVVGYEDLDGYGDWRASADYGEVWYPTRVAAGWAPYHDGHWAWVDPWGWTWVDHAPWGFAPSHYGRWAYIDNRWGWIPGPAVGHAVYAPALVAFVGGASLSIGIGGGAPVGWFPLGPRDVYQPPYRVTRDYFTSINVTNVRVVNTTVINNVYINYSSNKRGGPILYGNRNVPGAVTVVPRNVFIGARPVAAAALKINVQELAKASVTPVMRVAPSAESIGVGIGTRPAGALPSQQLSRPVIARHAPPAPPAPFAERVKAIASQGGAPLAPTQLKALRQAHANEAHAPPRVVMAAPGGSAAAAHPDNRKGSAEPVAPTEPSRTNPAKPTTVDAMPAGSAPVRPSDAAMGTQVPHTRSPQETPTHEHPGATRPKEPSRAAAADASAAVTPAAVAPKGSAGQPNQDHAPARAPRSNEGAEPSVVRDHPGGHVQERPSQQAAPRVETSRIPPQAVAPKPHEQQAAAEQPHAASAPIAHHEPATEHNEAQHGAAPAQAAEVAKHNDQQSLRTGPKGVTPATKDTHPEKAEKPKDKADKDKDDKDQQH